MTKKVISVLAAASLVLNMTPPKLNYVDYHEVSLLMVGDILLHDPIEAAAKQQDGSYKYDNLFADTRGLVENADISIVNQEVIIGGKELGVDGYPCFNAPFEVADQLVDTGFDVICHGTNHAMDKGKAGIVNCLEYWDNTYPDKKVLGIHNTQEDSQDICIIDREGIKIAILNYTYGTNGISLPADMPYAVDLLEENKVIADIKKAEEEADFTVVCPHWGTEYNLETDYMQKQWTDIFLKNGVDLVIGTHPHVIEPVEYLRDKDTGNQMLVYYSLGNFVNWTSGRGVGVANRMVGGMARVTLLKVNDKIRIKEYKIEPLVCHLRSKDAGVRVYPLAEYTEELAEENEIRYQDSNFSYEYVNKLCKDVWGDLFFPDNKGMNK